MIGWRLYEPGPLRDVLEHLAEGQRRYTGSTRGEPMPVNAHQTPTELVIEAMVPGVRPEDVEISSADGMLTISARSTFSERDYQHQEFSQVVYHRQLMLPADIRFDDATADIEHGVLTIRIPKLRPREPERIKIEVHRKAAAAQPIEATKGEGYREVEKPAARAVATAPAPKAAPAKAAPKRKPATKKSS